MSRIDWCIVPSVWWEIFCLVISEAWMFGRPVIVSNVGGPKERVTHEVDGLHFEVGDPQSLAETMVRACTETGLWDQLVAGITPAPDRDVMVRQYCDLYLDPEKGDSRAPASSHVGTSEIQHINRLRTTN
jgi:glycosyltransferase involved in cell wall biosynthesis